MAKTGRRSQDATGDAISFGVHEVSYCVLNDIERFQIQVSMNPLRERQNFR